MGVNFLVLRLDFAKKIHDPARENKWLGPKEWWDGKDSGAIHFGVGYPF